MGRQFNKEKVIVLSIKLNVHFIPLGKMHAKLGISVSLLFGSLFLAFIIDFEKCKRESYNYVINKTIRLKFS